MPRQRDVTLRAQWLGQMLRELRERTGLRLRDAADYLQRDVTSVSRFETGVYPIRRGDVFALMDLYDVTDKSQREMLLQLSDELWKTGWWDRHSKDVDEWVIDLVWLEDRAERIRDYNASLIGGLLQTRSYAEELIRVDGPDASQAQVERWLDLRMSRQDVLDREDLQLSFVLDEAALIRPIGGRTVMAEQLRHLADMRRRNVEIRVLPLEVGAHRGLLGSFKLLTPPEPFPEVAYVESQAGALYTETVDAERLADRYDHLWKSSLDPARSREFLARVTQESA